MDVCTARFERRLVEETSSLRLEMAGLRADLRQEIAKLGADLRQEMAALGANLRQEMAAGRFELLKWCFFFWAGEVMAISAILGVMLRFARS